jgi:hypothetical protein
MLSDFFRINLPYGLKRNSNNEWFAFNREYVPLGWNSTDGHESIHDDKAFSKFQVYTKYKGLTENAILKIIKNPDAIQKDKEGKIAFVFFYNDKTNPQSSPQYWNEYFDIIKAFSKFDRATHE